MILRLVKMTFEPQYCNDFIRLFDEIKQDIENQVGLVQLKLYRDSENEFTFFTHSVWTSHQHLDNYRNSDFFGKIWPKTKSLFSVKPEAWTLKLM